MDRYREAVMFSSEEMARRPSIVSLPVVGAIDGDCGDQHRTSRTQGSRLWINPLMSMYWAFDLDAVARRCLYLEHLRDTTTSWEVSARIETFRARNPTKPWEDIPV
ncbi:hypothetical protein [Corallococcus sp. AS-1-6]|uniref:hypothetical protein n=1 Tax=Corallococcus sp. AS-1-6 TaxID=2874599 RepID=UPI001CBAE0EA|nr:hypothetical protein [Corallococcus sp. AS-1-6]MBZ4374767.1 hypothetical protein [Corallococcus sp. AS-1-6]